LLLQRLIGHVIKHEHSPNVRVRRYFAALERGSDHMAEGWSVREDIPVQAYFNLARSQEVNKSAVTAENAEEFCAG
jgi:hypothetical protein